jgi:hypothetical protein
MNIPKIIHRIQLETQTAASDVVREGSLSPSWECRLWKAQLPEGLICKEQLDFLLHNSKLKYPLWKRKYRLAGLINILKYELLYQFGGLYVDHRSRFLNPLPDELIENDSFACQENAAMWPGLVSSSHLGATRHNALMRLVLEEIKTLSESELIEQVCPNFHNSMFLTEVCRRHGYEKLKIYPDHCFVSDYASYETNQRAPETAYCAIPDEKQVRFATALLDFKQIMDANRVRFFIICGAALGIRREGRFIAHDDDIDTGVFYEDYDPSVEQQILDNGFTLRVRYGRPATGYEVSFRHTKTNTLIDIFLHYSDNTSPREHIWFASGFRNTFQDGFCRFIQAPFSLRPINFLGTEFLLPDPIDRYLAASYGEDWRTPRDFGFYDGMQKGYYKSMVLNSELDSFLGMLPGKR